MGDLGTGGLATAFAVMVAVGETFLFRVFQVSLLPRPHLLLWHTSVFYVSIHLYSFGQSYLRRGS